MMNKGGGGGEYAVLDPKMAILLYLKVIVGAEAYSRGRVLREGNKIHMLVRRCAERALHLMDTTKHSFYSASPCLAAGYSF